MKKTSYAMFINSLSLGWEPCPPAPGLEKHIVMFGAVVALGGRILPSSVNLTWKPLEQTQGS